MLQGLLEVRDAMMWMKDNLKAVKEVQREFQSTPRSQSTPRRISGKGGDDEQSGEGGIIREVQALRDCIVQGEAAIHQLAPRLLEAAHRGKDFRLIHSAKCLQAAVGSSSAGPVVPPRTGPEIYRICEEEDEDSQAQSFTESREYPLSPEKAQTQGGQTSSCLGGCFRGMI